METEELRMDGERAYVSPLRKMLGADGWCGKLLTPIRKVEIVPSHVANAFKLFLNRITVGETFTVAELLMGSELMLRREVYGKPGDGIYLLKEPIRDTRLGNTLMGRSVPGLYGLLTAADGAELELPAGIDEDRLAHERLLLLREHDGDRLTASDLFPIVRVGTVVPNRLHISTPAGSEDLSDLLSREPLSLTIRDEDAGAFRPAAHALLGYTCCGMFPGKYYVNLSSDGTLEQLLAGALGLFEAMALYRFPLPPMRFNANGNTGVVVPRPELYAGDQVYVFRPRTAPNGYAMHVELDKMRVFLMESYRTKKVRSILPLKGNAPEMLRRMGGDKLAYVEELPLPMDSFAMLGILPAGEQAPGTRVGSYRAVETEPEENQEM